MNFRAELRNYGVSHRSVRTFGASAQPDLLDYLDLIDPRGPRGVLPDGVAESQGRPLLFFVNESRLAQPPAEKETQLQHLRRSLACRGDRAYLARIRPGELLVTPASLADRTMHWELYKPGSGESLTFFSRLALGYYDGKGKPDDADFIFKEMLRVLESGIDRITRQIGWTDVLSLVGRALFFRFLRDRQIVTEDDRTRIAPKADGLLACFDNAQNAHDTCRWLDKTFNGDFLPLSDGGNRAFFDGITQRSQLVFEHLRAIVHGLEPVGATDYQTRLNLKWSDFDFAHIPVGLLSQVYEAFCWKWDPTARATSVHYTPRNIAATLVDEVFDQLPNPHKARVLDPACGASVFLVLVLRRLYRERWKHDGKRPGTAVIRELLEKKITGFDISDSALKLSALSLYLTAIELDPKPVPPEGLKFRSLRNRVLFSTRGSKDPKSGVVIGSLGPRIGKRFDGQFDLILSNPPWTSVSPDKFAKGAEEKAHLDAVAAAMEKVSKAVIARKDETLAKQYRNPDRVPDLPFLWKSTEWCKPDGRIAMALPARMLFKQGDISRQAREAIFRLIGVTGIINCSNLRKTNVWPDMDQPFMLLFASNRQPKSGQLIRFVTPHTDAGLNALGEMRIDTKSAQPFDAAATFDEPWLWKALTVGTSLDVEVVRKLRAAGGHPLQSHWEDELGLVSSTGYQVKPEQKVRQDSKFLKVLPDLHSPCPTLTDTAAPRFVVDTSRLLLFSRDTLFRTRKRKTDPLMVYRSPLALVMEAPGMNRNDGRALLSFEDIAYNESFFGYSAAGHADEQTLVRYLHLFVHSQLWLHYALLTSAKLGVERPRFYKADLDECPIIPLERLSADEKRTMIALSQKLIAEDASVFDDIDSFFGSLYGLDQRDLQVIRDTLEVRDPNDELGKRASKPPTAPECASFRRKLESVLRPFFKVLGKEPQITMWKPLSSRPVPDAPFTVLLVGERGGKLTEPDTLFREKVLPLANETGSTRIIEPVKGGLVVGLLRQYRYWTPSRARLLGAEIVRKHMGVFED